MANHNIRCHFMGCDHIARDSVHFVAFRGIIWTVHALHGISRHFVKFCGMHDTGVSWDSAAFRAFSGMTRRSMADSVAFRGGSGHDIGFHGIVYIYSKHTTDCTYDEPIRPLQFDCFRSNIICSVTTNDCSMLVPGRLWVTWHHSSRICTLDQNAPTYRCLTGNFGRFGVRTGDALCANDFESATLIA